MTPSRLASIYLDQENGRIRRLRKIKSVLVSSNMTRGGPPINASQNRRRRLPYPDASHRNAQADHRREGSLPDASGRVRDGHLPSLAPKVSSCALTNADEKPFPGMTPTTEVLDDVVDHSRSSQCVSLYSSWGGGMPARKMPGDSMSERTSNEFAVKNKLLRAHFITHKKNKRHDTNSGGISPDFGYPAREYSRVDASTLSSEPSAIDLFDHCGEIPASADKNEEPIQMPRSHKRDDGFTASMTMVNGEVGQMSPSRMLATKRPVVPEAPGGIYGRVGLDKNSRSVRARAKLDTVRRACVPVSAAKSGSLAVGDVLPPRSRGCKMRRLPGRGQGRTGDSIKGRQVPHLDCKQSNDHTTLCSDTSQTETEGRGKSTRVRRRWKLDHNRGQQSAVTASGRGDDQGNEIASARLVNAQARFCKNMGIDELKSERVEALSILKHLSAPSSATSNRTREEEEERGRSPYQAEQSELSRKGKSKSSSQLCANGKGHSVACPLESNEHVGQMLSDAAIERLSNDLPRIGSREEAALRSLYRKWWMKVVNGAPLPPSTPDMPGPSERISLGVECRPQDVLGDAGQRSPSTGSVASADPHSAIPLGAEPEKRSSPEVLNVDEQPTQMTPFHDEDSRHEPCRISSLLSNSQQENEMAQDGENEENEEGKENKELRCTIGGDLPSSEMAESGICPEIGSIEGEPGSLHIDNNTGTDNKHLPEVIDSSVPIGAGALERDERNECKRPNNPLAVREVHNIDSKEELSAMTSRSSTRSSARGDQFQQNIGSVAERPADESNEPLSAMPGQRDSEVESIPDNGDVTGEEEGHHGRIYLPNGRFVSTHRNTGDQDSKEKERANPDSAPCLDASETSEYDDEEFDV